MSIVLKTPSNGSVTLAEEDTASNVTVTIPAGTSTLVTNATLPTQLNASGSAPIYACRAWVNFDGTGTVAIRASGNVSSITDNGTGNYTVNFTTAMADANYAAIASTIGAGDANTVATPGDSSALSTTSARFRVIRDDATGIDAATVSAAIFR